MSSAPTLFLIDGSNQMYRAYHAIRGLTGPEGQSTNAVYGFITMLRKLLEDHKPEYIAASYRIFCGSSSTWAEVIVSASAARTRVRNRQMRSMETSSPAAAGTGSTPCKSQRSFPHPMAFHAGREKKHQKPAFPLL